jgi:Tfp pilus assembly protein PilF
MKKLYVLILLLSTAMIASSQTVKENQIPVTTNSKSALSFYNEAKKYFDDVNVEKGLEAFKKALDKDPDFFMVNYQLAFFYLLNRSSDEFMKYSEAALDCKAELSDAEKLLKDALTRLKEGQMNVTDVGKKLVNMYPEDPDSYNNLVSFQSLAGDSVGIVETLKKAITIARNPAPFYNQIGYAYLTLKQTDKAKEAFDKYIELDPGNPNVYDSKGDYFMYIKSYDQAYESYMKAYSIDSAFSKDKANAAKQLYEEKEGKTLEIITM